jgi:hypothetical protein
MSVCDCGKTSLDYDRLEANESPNSRRSSFSDDNSVSLVKGENARAPAWHLSDARARLEVGYSPYGIWREKSGDFGYVTKCSKYKF